MIKKLRIYYLIKDKQHFYFYLGKEFLSLEKTITILSISNLYLDTF